MSSYRLMDAEKATPDKATAAKPGSEEPGFEIARMAGLLEVSRSGYYAWQRREQAGPTPRQQRRTALIDKITKFHTDSDHVYGSPRILADLRDDGETVSRKTVAKLMRSNGIVGISPRGWTPVTTWPDLAAQALPDLVGRRFDQGQLNKVWTSDITYLATGQGWLYLCAVRDGCSRRVLGWSVHDHLRADLVDQALTMAVVLRGSLPDKVIFHADRGTQVHLQPDRRPVRRPRPAAIGRPDRGLLGQRTRRIVLVHPENRVLQPAQLAHQDRSPTGRRPLARRALQPETAALRHRHDDPRPVRTPSTDGYPGRLIACPPDGVTPSQAACVVWVWNSSNRTGLIIPTEECRLSRLCG